jgi:hypothetical protein
LSSTTLDVFEMILNDSINIVFFVCDHVAWEWEAEYIPPENIDPFFVVVVCSPPFGNLHHLAQL